MWLGPAVSPPATSPHRRRVQGAQTAELHPARRRQHSSPESIPASAGTNATEHVHPGENRDPCSHHTCQPPQFPVPRAPEAGCTWPQRLPREETRPEQQGRWCRRGKGVRSTVVVTTKSLQACATPQRRPHIIRRTPRPSRSHTRSLHCQLRSPTLLLPTQTKRPPPAGTGPLGTDQRASGTSPELGRHSAEGREPWDPEHPPSTLLVLPAMLGHRGRHCQVLVPTDA